MDNKELIDLLELKGIPCSDDQATQLFRYAKYIIRKNDEINLTAITDKNEFMDKMVFDSALPLTLTSFKNKTILDVGTGAGFPGVVIKILTNENVSLLDATKKKLKVIQGFGLDGLTYIDQRVEDFAIFNKERYDIVIARAVAPLNVLLELCLPLVKIGGVFIAMKGSDGLNELEQSKKALNVLNGSVIKKDVFELPNGDGRVNILIKKMSSCPNKYPREFKDIKNYPL